MEGFDEFINDLKKVNDNVDKELNNLVNRLSNRVLRKVKMRTPVGAVRGGTLRRSWKNKKVNEYERVIYNNVEYAPHVEYGHRVVRNGKVVGYVEGRYMLKRSFEEVEAITDKELEKTMDKILNGGG